MFDRIAGVYDLMNTVMTAGMHHRWRERAGDRAELVPGDTALDLCCGTGDLALALARRVGPEGSVVGCDFSERMLDLARRKAAERGASQVRFEWADALELPYPDRSFDAVAVGFGARNLVDLERGCPVLGGRCMFVEQAAEQFTLFTGQPAPRQVMEGALHGVRGYPEYSVRYLLTPTIHSITVAGSRGASINFH